MNKVKILLADDMESLHSDIRHTLDGADFPYEIVADFYQTDQLLDYLLDHEDDIDQTADMLILDHDFGGRGKNGLEILPELRDYAPRLPVLMLTTMNYSPDFVKAQKQYGVDYIQKPVKASDIACRIGSSIFRQDMQNELDELHTQMEQWESYAQKFRDKGLDLDLDDPDISRKIDEIAEAIAKNTISSNQDVFQKCLTDYKEKYPHLPADILEYLASSELLFLTYEKSYSQDEKKGAADLAPIALNYFRALEAVLRLIIQRKNLATPHYQKCGKTLGEAIEVMKKTMLAQYGYPAYQDLKKLLKLRNTKIAHCGDKLLRDDLLLARELMFESGGHHGLFSCFNELLA